MTNTHIFEREPPEGAAEIGESSGAPADGDLSIVYSDPKNVLVINEKEDADYIIVIFVSGISYENFMKVTANGGIIF